MSLTDLLTFIARMTILFVLVSAILCGLNLLFIYLSEKLTEYLEMRSYSPSPAALRMQRAEQLRRELWEDNGRKNNRVIYSVGNMAVLHDPLRISRDRSIDSKSIDSLEELIKSVKAGEGKFYQLNQKEL